MLEKTIDRTFDRLFELGIVFVILALVIGGLIYLWQRSEKALAAEKLARLEDEKLWHVEFKQQELRHGGEIKQLTDENKTLNEKRLNGAIDMLTFVRGMEDAIKKGDVSAAINELKMMVRRIAKHQNIDVD